MKELERFRAKLERREQAKQQMEKAQEEQLLRDGIERLKKRFGTLELQDCFDQNGEQIEQPSSVGSIDHLADVVSVPNLNFEKLEPTGLGECSNIQIKQERLAKVQKRQQVTSTPAELGRALTQQQQEERRTAGILKKKNK